VDEERVALAYDVARHLRGRSIACAESLIAGRVASALAMVDGAVAFFRGGLVAYQPAVKASLLSVTTESVLSLEAAEQMARGAARLLDADVTVSTTGLAGGEPEDGVEVGAVFLATFVDGVVSSARYHFDACPERVCDLAARQALADLCASLTGYA
jgi:nicotinamide-nucleotide amidase